MRSFRRAGAGLALVAAAAVWTTPAPADDVTAAADGTTVAVQAPAEPSPTLSVRDVRVEQVGTARRVNVALSRAPERVRSFSLDRPPRLVLDLSGPLARGSEREQRFPVEDAVVDKARVARFNNRLRVVIDLRQPAQHQTVSTQGTGLIAELSDGIAQATEPAQPAAREAVAAAVVTATPTTQAAGEPVVAASLAPATPAPASFDRTDAIAAPVETAEAKAEPIAVAAAKPAPIEIAPAKAEPTKAAAAKAEHITAAPIAVAKDDVDPIATEPTAAAPEAAPADAAKDTPAKAAPPAPAQPDAVAVALPEDRPVVLATATVAPAAKRAVAQGKHVVLPPAAPFNGGVYGGQKISLDFKDADIQNVLRVLADVSEMNIIATDDVKGKVTLHLSEVPWDQALDLVLRTNRLESTREGNVVRISTVARLKEEREALREAEDASIELEPLRISYQRVNYARADEAFIDKVKGVLTDRGSVTFDDRTNTIIIRDIQTGINDAEHLIRELDVQSPQVLIEANIVEATEDFARGLGVQWGYRYAGGPTTGTPTGQNFPGSIGVGGSGLGAGAAPPTGTGAPGVPVPFLADFPVPSGFGSGFGPNAGSAFDLALGSLDGTSTLVARLTALEEEGKGKVISRPRVITMNNVAATIQSLTILRVKLPSTGTVINTGTGGAAGTASTATEKINTGITLVVTPQVSADGFVLMNIYAKSSVPDFSRAVEGIPTEISREANSNVLIKNGETVVLGGIFRHLIDDRESGIPYLRAIPGLGWLFKRDLDSNRQEELLVFLTPKVVDPGNAGLPNSERLWDQRSKGG